MSVDCRHPLPRIRTMCAALLVFAATATISRSSIQGMAPTPWRGRQIAPHDRAAKPTGAVQTSIAKKGTLT